MIFFFPQVSFKHSKLVHVCIVHITNLFTQMSTYSSLIKALRRRTIKLLKLVSDPFV